MILRSFYTLLLVALTFPFCARASHITGGSMTYKYLRDTILPGNQQARNYEVRLVIYEDIVNGQPEAVMQDNPAFLSCFVNQSPSYTYFSSDTAVYYASFDSVKTKIVDNCYSAMPGYPIRLLAKTFIKRYTLPKNTSGYVISFQRCCRNATIGNIRSPGDNGTTIFCTIPGNIANSSAVFKNEAPHGMCLNQALSFDHSATDADGDSLSYEFCPAFLGASDADIKPIPGPPPYDSVKYLAPFTASQPLPSESPFSLDAVTGKITGLPSMQGRYLVNVCSKEWRNGELINTTYRQFSCIVGPCNIISQTFKPDIGGDTTIFAGQRIRLHGGPGIHYSWTPTTSVSDSEASDPFAYFPIPGTFYVSVLVMNDNGCSGTDTKTIHVLSHSEFAVPNAFTPNGDNLNDVLIPVPVLGSKLINFKVFNRWGNLVYNGGPSDPGWDGTYKGTLQNMAVYYWHLEYEDTYGEQQSMSGNVTLLR